MHKVTVHPTPFKSVNGKRELHMVPVLYLQITFIIEDDADKMMLTGKICTKVT